MANFISQNYFKFIGIFLGLALGFGIWLTVQAVAPNTVTDPTFGPSDDNVQLNLAIACSWNGWYCSSVNCEGDVDNGVDGWYNILDLYCDGYIPGPPEIKGRVTQAQRLQPTIR